MANRGVSHAHRGQALENEIERTIGNYAAQGVATIQKVAVPTKVLPDRKRGPDAVRTLRQKSTVDFIGAWKGRALAFDAKENRDPARFPLKNLHDHQFDFLANWDRDGGVAFLLILHEPDQRVYLMPFAMLDLHWRLWKSGGRASVPVSELRQLLRVPAGRGCTIDFLAPIEAWIAAQNGGAK